MVRGGFSRKLQKLQRKFFSTAKKVFRLSTRETFASKLFRITFVQFGIRFPVRSSAGSSPLRRKRFASNVNNILSARSLLWSRGRRLGINLPEESSLVKSCFSSKAGRKFQAELAFDARVSCGSFSASFSFSKQVPPAFHGKFTKSRRKFVALSPDQCRPSVPERIGLDLGQIRFFQIRFFRGYFRVLVVSFHGFLKVSLGLSRIQTF